MQVHPIKFIKPKTELEVAFASGDDPDEIEWYKGTVRHLNFYGHDNKGRFVNCWIDYDDGESVPDAFFYDCDFNIKLKDDAWRFTGTIALLMSLVIQNQDWYSEASESEWNSEESDTDSAWESNSDASKNTVISKKKYSIFGLLYKSIPVINTIMLSYLTYKFLDSK
jgi:hypothetical protein